MSTFTVSEFCSSYLPAVLCSGVSLPLLFRQTEGDPRDEGEKGRGKEEDSLLAPRPGALQMPCSFDHAAADPTPGSSASRHSGTPCTDASRNPIPGFAPASVCSTPCSTSSTTRSTTTTAPVVMRTTTQIRFEPKVVSAYVSFDRVCDVEGSRRKQRSRS